MPDAITSLDAFIGKELLVRRITNISDGTGEASAIKVTRSTFVSSLPSGAAPTKFGLEELWYSIQGFTSVRLFWDNAAPEVMALMAAGNGMRCSSGLRGVSGLLLPSGSGGTGNITLSTAGAAAGATYDILMVLKAIP